MRTRVQTFLCMTMCLNSFVSHFGLCKDSFHNMVSKINSPLAPSLGLALLVFSTFVLGLAVLPLVVALVVLPPPLVQVVGPTSPCKLLPEIIITSTTTQ